MGTMVRIRAHLAGTPAHDEDTAETIILVVLLDGNRKIVPGVYFGQIIEIQEPYPFRYEALRSSQEAGLYFGSYSRADEVSKEEVYKTNLHDKKVAQGEYFSVITSDLTDYTYVIEVVTDMNAQVV